jgi:ABC-type multidrug transport system ATPase subunit
MSETIIKADRVAKSFSHLTILENVCFEVNQGDRYGLVGLNGAGKTTLIRLLLGVLKPSRGTLSVLGIDPWFHDPAQLQRMGVVLEHDGFWGNLTFDQNMRIFAEAKGIARNQAMAYIDQYWSTTSLYRNKKPVKLFSRGQRMLCAIARAFMGWPKVYFFDEPAVALDVGAYDHFRGLVKTATSQGATFFISSHQLEAIDDLCDRVGMLRNRCITELDLGAQNNGKEQWALGAGKTENGVLTWMILKL